MNRKKFNWETGNPKTNRPTKLDNKTAKVGLTLSEKKLLDDIKSWTIKDDTVQSIIRNIERL